MSVNPLRGMGILKKSENVTTMPKYGLPINGLSQVNCAGVKDKSKDCYNNRK